MAGAPYAGAAQPTPGPQGVPVPPAYGYAPPSNADLPTWAPAALGKKVYGGFGKRILARLLDCVPIYILQILFVIVAAAGRAKATVDLGGGVTYEAHAGLLSTDRAGWSAVLMVILTVVMFAYFIWNFLIRQGRTGKTIGKTAMKITARTYETGAVPGIGRVLAREVLDFLNALVFGLGYWWVLGDRKSQTFTDKIAAVVVVDDAMMAAGSQPVVGYPTMQQ